MIVLVAIYGLPDVLTAQNTDTQRQPCSWKTLAGKGSGERRAGGSFGSSRMARTVPAGRIEGGGRHGSGVAPERVTVKQLALMGVARVAWSSARIVGSVTGPSSVSTEEIQRRSTVSSMPATTHLSLHTPSFSPCGVKQSEKTAAVIIRCQTCFITELITCSELASRLSTAAVLKWRRFGEEHVVFWACGAWWSAVTANRQFNPTILLCIGALMAKELY